MYPNATQWVPFLDCYEGKGILTDFNAKRCARKSGFDFDKIEACNTGDDGKALDVSNAKKTLAFKGEWKGTPTVTVGGTHTEDLFGAVCAAFLGVKPAGCTRKGF
jgi:hypothetical protein